jgi:hypothetical protein
MGTEFLTENIRICSSGLTVVASVGSGDILLGIRVVSIETSHGLAKKKKKVLISFRFNSQWYCSLLILLSIEIKMMTKCSCKAQCHSVHLEKMFTIYATYFI